MIFSRAVYKLYLAAALSFAFGILRDWAFVHQIENYAEIYSVLYAAAIASSFPVNAIMLGQAGGRLGLTVVYVLLGGGLYLGIAILNGAQDAEMLLLGLPIPVFQIIGAIYARRLLDAEMPFLGRLREAVSSAAMCCFAMGGFNALALTLGAGVGMSFALFCATRYTRGLKVLSPLAVDRGALHFLQSLIFCNLSTALMNTWALVANDHKESIFEVSATVAVRFSMYFFQVASVPAVLFTHAKVPSLLHRNSKLIFGLTSAIALASMFVRLPIAISLMPILCSIVLYSSVLALREKWTSD